jgi:hypothetical protein
MKTITVLSFIFVLEFFFTCNVRAQNEPSPRLVADFGVLKTTGLDDNISNDLSLLTGLSFEKPFVFSRNFYFITGVGVHSQQYFIDGYFNKQGNSTVFTPVENGVINNKLRLVMIKLPLLFSMPLFSKNNQAIAVNFGADVDFFLTGARQYKQYNGGELKEKFTIDNKVQVPLRLEISTLNLSKQKSVDNLFYGFGVRQQLTNYLKTESFKTFQAYFRLGIQF